MEETMAMEEDLVISNSNIDDSSSPKESTPVKPCADIEANDAKILEDPPELHRTASYRGKTSAQHLRTHSFASSQVSMQEIYSNHASAEPPDDPAESPEVVKQRRGKMIKNARDLIILVVLCMVEFNGFLAFSMIAPFFPIEANLKNVSSTVTGFVFAIHPLVVFFLSPFVGKWIPKHGAKIFVVVGTFGIGLGQFLFAFVTKLQNRVLFVVACFVARIVISIGTAFANTAGLAYLTEKFNAHLSVVFGITELFVGFGFMAGPSLGGVLYGTGGFYLPFIVVGSLTFLNLIFIWFSVPQDKPKEKKETAEITGAQKNAGRQITLTKSLKMPAVLMVALVIHTIGFFITFLQPTFTFHLQKITNNTISVEKVGLVFFLSPGVYAILAPIGGIIFDKWFDGRNALIIGHFMVFGCYLFMGPSPILNLKTSLTLTSVAYALLGVAQCPIMVPVLADLQISIVNAGYANDFSTASVVSGIFTSAINLGQVLGPAIGGLLQDHMEFPWSSTIVAFFVLLEGIALLLFTLYERSCGVCCCKPTSYNINEEHTTPNGELNIAYNVGEVEVISHSNKTE